MSCLLGLASSRSVVAAGPKAVESCRVPTQTLMADSCRRRPEVAHQSGSAFHDQLTLPVQLSYAVKPPVLRSVARPVFQANHVAGELADLEEKVGLDLVVGPGHQRPSDGDHGVRLSLWTQASSSGISTMQVWSLAYSAVQATWTSVSLGSRRGHIGDVAPPVFNIEIGDVDYALVGYRAASAGGPSAWRPHRLNPRLTHGDERWPCVRPACPGDGGSQDMRAISCTGARPGPRQIAPSTLSGWLRM